MDKIKSNEKVRVVVRTINRYPPKQDYLKFYKVARYWAKRNYNLTGAELDMMIFLRSEYLFTRDAFDEFHNIFSWNTSRFEKMVRDGWIKKWRNDGGGKKAVYELSKAGKRLVDDVYRKCNGDDLFSELPSKNRCFDRSRVNFADKVYSSQMKKINAINRKRRKEE